VAPGARTSFWAVPDASSRRWCDGRIAALASRAGTRAFAAHVTLLGDVGGTWAYDEVAATLRGIDPVRVELTDVDDDDATYRCVTLRAAPAGPTRLRGALATVLTDRGAGAFHPHLSVLYGSFDAKRRRELIRDVQLETPLAPVTIDAVAAWDTSHDDWSAWRELASWPLRGDAG
jgi:hypothetical protein